MLKRPVLRIVAAATAIAAQGAALAAEPTVLRVVPQADLRVLDPHVTTATVTRMHGQMVYDTLYALDEKQAPQPEMVAERTVSPDRLTYEFTLRDGLRFSSGEAVTSADVVASVTRAMRTDPLLQLMKRRLAAFEAIDARRFRIRLMQPFNAVELALAGNAAVIMRAADIAGPAGDAPVTTVTGSGPFRFVTSAHNPGARVVYERNPDYVPRPEPASGLAGGKVARVDRVEWLIIPDLQTRVAALQRGEVDVLDQLPHDGIQSLANRPDIVVEANSPLGNWAYIRVNALHPPFNDVRARRALALLVVQEDYLSAAFTTDRTWWQPCYSFLGCNTPNASDAGSEPYRHGPDPQRARQLLTEAGYKGEPIRILSSTEIPLIDALAQVTADKLRQAGVAVDVEMSDWGTLVVRRARKDPPAQGGWNIYQTASDLSTIMVPAINPVIDSRCDGNNMAGWPCSERLEAMRAELIDDPSPAKLDAYSRLLWEDLPTIPLGQYRQPIARRSNVTGLPHSPFLVFWNTEKR